MTEPDVLAGSDVSHSTYGLAGRSCLELSGVEGNAGAIIIRIGVWGIFYNK